MGFKTEWFIISWHTCSRRRNKQKQYEELFRRTLDQHLDNNTDNFSRPCEHKNQFKHSYNHRAKCSRQRQGKNPQSTHYIESNLIFVSKDFTFKVKEQEPIHETVLFQRQSIENKCTLWTSLSHKKSSIERSVITISYNWMTSDIKLRTMNIMDKSPNYAESQ